MPYIPSNARCLRACSLFLSASAAASAALRWASILMPAATASSVLSRCAKVSTLNLSFSCSSICSNLRLIWLLLELTCLSAIFSSSRSSACFAHSIIFFSALT